MSTSVPEMDSKRRFEDIYNKYFEKLFYFSKKITKSEELAKDVVADVFLNLLNMKADLAMIKDLETYLFVSVKNISIQAITRDPKNLYTQDFENSLRRIDGLNPEEVLIGKELEIAIERAIESLPAQCKLVYQFAKREGLNYEEIASELNISSNTVRNHMIKAIKVIKTEVKNHVNDDSKDSGVYAYIGVLAFIFHIPLNYC